MNVATHMEVVHLAVRRNLGKQSLIVVGGSRDIDADGVAIAVERAIITIITQKSFIT